MTYGRTKWDCGERTKPERRNPTSTAVRRHISGRVLSQIVPPAYDSQEGGINAIIFKIEKKPQRVYFGDWGEFVNMQIYWKDDGCLVINSVEYEIE